MEKTDILFVGGGPAGVISAVTAHRYYPEKKIILIKSVEKGVIPCGIPYMFSSLKNCEENALDNTPLEKNNVNVLIDEVVKISPDEKIVETKKNKEYQYEKLILAIGSNCIVPPIDGIDKENVFAIYKDMVYLKNLSEKIKNFKNVLILGGGFIGVEFADEFSNHKHLNVHLVEMLPSILMRSFDPEFSSLARNELESKGVNVLTGVAVEKILGNKKVEKVQLSNGRKLNIDCVILGIGALPNIQIAREAGIDLGRGKGIWVDEYMRTSKADIMAIGDCAGKRDFFTHRDAPVMLASTATAEARIAGANLYKLKIVKGLKLTLGGLQQRLHKQLMMLPC